MALPTDALAFADNSTELFDGSDAMEANNDTFTDLFLEQVAMTLNVFYTPVLVVLGSIGNFISIFVFRKTKLRGQSTSQYLTALAISDSLFLWQLVPPWLKAVGASPLFARHGYCQVFVYLSYVTCCTSSWLVVGFTIERFVAVVYPFRRNAMCTVRRARFLIASFVTCSLLVNLPVIWFAVPGSGDCNIDEEMMAHAERFNLFDTLGAFTFPLAIIIVLNTWIMAGVYRVGWARGHLFRQQRQNRPRPPETSRAAAAVGARSQQRVTRMLLIVSTVFVALNLPAYSLRIVAYTHGVKNHHYTRTWAAIQQICLLCFNTNFGINFILYCLTGQNFRRELYDSIPCMRRRNLELIAMENMMERPARASSISTSFAYSISNYEASHNGASTSGVRRAGHSGLGQAGTSRNGAPQGGDLEDRACSTSRDGAHAGTSRTGLSQPGTSRGRASLPGTMRGAASQAGTSRGEASQASRNRSPQVGRSRTEYASSHYPVRGGAMPGGVRNERSYSINRVPVLGRRRPQVIQRWRFDNSRQRREPQDVQPAAAALPPAGDF